ncbi:sigma factor-like helix-turn-helix DNA-binding protein [Mahella australiensis]|uniref:Sigma-70 region 4 type 2 n=1 Tax=Mahella australiensis (strain DSM 15567 / CIP 107919 / 50-1 BON) TaxID=697281 RepID=F3ZVF4_MAHA5|nr:sigma factor-like helix-turn-helix DNA-binding protein [Mahella australiensis]AEE95304.1 Sigma-70 region 4 type 2 [Mahella australiensis 50-1 BON]
MIPFWAIDKLLYNLPEIKAQYENLEAEGSSSIVVLVRQSGGYSSKTEKVAIDRAVLGMIIDATERGIKALPKRCKKIYRMKYRAYMSYKEIASRLFMSTKTVERRVNEIRSVVGQHLSGLHEDEVTEFWRVFDVKLTDF